MIILVLKDAREIVTRFEANRFKPMVEPFDTY